MDTQSVGPYSPTTVYGEFTSPFKYSKNKPIHINSHTPYDKPIAEKESEEVFSRKFFKGKPPAKNIYEHLTNEKYLKDVKENKNTQNYNKINNPLVNKKDEKEPTKNEIVAFAYSSLKDDSNKILNDAISKRGYNSDEVIIMKKALESYKKSSTITKDPVNALSTCYYNVY